MFRTIVLISLFLKWLTDIPSVEDTQNITTIHVTSERDHVSAPSVVNNMTLFRNPRDGAESQSNNYD